MATERHYYELESSQQSPEGGASRSDEPQED